MSGAERKTARPPRSQTAPLDRATRTRAEQRLGTDLSGVRVARDAAADQLAQSYNARALTTGNLVVLGASAEPADLGHELVHVAQRALHGTGVAARSQRSDAAEAEARRLGPKVLTAGTPLVIGARPDARVSLNGGGDDTEPTPAERGWSFDPYATDVATMDNAFLVTTTLAHREWLSNHAIIELDWEAHRIALDRLDIEREWRIELGHLWLTDIDEGVSHVVQLVAGKNGAIDVVRPPDALVMGGAVDLSDQPIMSLAQFDTMRSAQGYSQVPLDSYLAEVTEVATDAQEPSPGHLESQINVQAVDAADAEEQRRLDEAYRQLFGLSGANSRLSARDTRLPDAFGVQNSSKRVGNLSEVIYGTSAENFFGYRGGLQDETVAQNHARTDYRRFFSDIDTSVKSRDPTAASYHDPNPMTRFQNYLRGQQALLGTEPGSNAFRRFMETSARGRTEAEVRAQSQMAIDLGDVDAYRALVGNPLALPHADATQPTYQYADVSRIYNGFLQDAPVHPADGSAPITTVAGLDAALADGRIGLMEHTAALNTVAQAARSQVVANPDFTSAQARSFQNAFEGLHPSLRPEAPEMPTRYRSRRSTTSATASHPSRVRRFGNYLERQSAMFNENGALLHVAPDDVRPYQELLRSPFSREASQSGRRTAQNYTLQPVRRVYDGILSQAPVTDAAGIEYRTMAAIDAARESGALTAREHYQLIDRVGRMAARTVAPDLPGAHAAHNRANTEARAEYDARLARANDYIRRNAAPEYLASVERGGGVRGDLSVARGYGGRAAGLGFLMGAGQEYYFSENGFEDPVVRDRVLWAGAREGTRGGLSATGETLAAQQTSRYLLREGLEVGATRAMLIRAGARFVPGGLVDVGFEGYDMLTDDRENSAGEVAYRSGRAFVVGGSSALAGAWAGAAAGTAVGTAVPVLGNAAGFVVGFLVGLGVGYAMSAAIPTYDEIQRPRSTRGRLRSSTAIDRAMANNRCPSHHRTRDPGMEIPLMPRSTQRSPLQDYIDQQFVGPPGPGQTNAHVTPAGTLPGNQLTQQEIDVLSEWINATPTSRSGDAAQQP